MFLERFAVFTLQIRAKLLELYNYVLQEADSQLGQIFFTCCLFLLSGLLFFVWVSSYPLWFQISFTIIYLIASLFCISALYFILKRKRIKTSSDGMEVYTFDDRESEKFQHFKLKAIPLTALQKQDLFNALSQQYINGSYRSFQSLTYLEPISTTERLEWKDVSPKNPKQANRQTLLEFLSQLMIGFENLENYQIKELVEHYFILKNIRRHHPNLIF